MINASRAGVGVFAYTHLPGASILKAFGENTTAKVVWDKGLGKIKINDQLFEPLSFRSFRPEQRNITDFHNAVIHLMSILHTGLDCTLDVPYSPFGESWIGPRQYDFTAIDRQMDLP